jgi:tRNA modification GTPase
MSLPVDATVNHATQLTPPGVSAIAVVRLSGPAVPNFFAAHFDRPVGMGRCVHGNLRGDAGVIDDPVIAWVTDEVVDVNLHGGTAVVRAVFELAWQAGFAVGPLMEAPVDLEAEVLAALPLARTEAAVRSLLAQTKLWSDITPSVASAALADRSGRWLVRTPTVAIVGPANVGKSTLANRLYGQDRAIVADRPGTTRDWVGAVADLGGLAVTLVDTPGVRATDDAIELAAVTAAADQIGAADLVVVVIDGSVPATADARAVLESHSGAIVVSNKADRPAIWAVPDSIRISASTGMGVDELFRAIRRRFEWEPVDVDQIRWWTERQREALVDLARR